MGGAEDQFVCRSEGEQWRQHCYWRVGYLRFRSVPSQWVLLGRTLIAFFL